MELTFYKLKNYEKTIWFTDATMAEFKEWAKENGVSYFSCWTADNRVGFVPFDENRVMFELFWGYDIRTPQRREVYYDDWADVAWSDWDDDNNY